MGTLLAAIRKELLLLARDKSGLAIIFLMPLTLVFFITLIQDAPLKQFQEVKLSLLLDDADGGAIGALVAERLSGSGAFDVTTRRSDGAAGGDAVGQEVAGGRFQVGIVVPSGATDAFIRSLAALRPGSAPGAGVGAGIARPTELLIHVDPTLPKQSRAAVLNALRYLTASIEREALAALLTGAAPPADPGGAGSLAVPTPEMLSARLVASGGGEAVIPNAVQQNVPAWTMFAMFFIVVPLAGTMLREKDDMISLRLLTMPSAFVTRVGGKVVVFLGVCLAQLFLMIGMGMHFLPLFGVPVLTVGDGVPALLVMAVAAALAATGYGILVGTVATSQVQAISFGAVSIIIAAVIGGVMVPVFAMPPPMQTLAGFSPLSWGLSGFLDVFLRGATVADVLPHAAKLALFAAATMTGSWLWFRARRRG